MSFDRLGDLLRRVQRHFPDCVGVDASDERWRRRMGEGLAELQYAWQKWCLANGVPRRYVTASFHTADWTPLLEYVRDYAAPRFDDDDRPGEGLSRGDSLLLAGPTGTGKTFAALCVLREELDDVQSADDIGFWYFPALAASLLDPSRRSAMLERAKSVEVAVFDDLGAEYAKEGGFVEALWDEIIWYREGSRLATIITTNFSIEQLKARFSDRIIDRLRGWGRTFVASGPSLREQGDET